MDEHLLDTIYRLAAATAVGVGVGLNRDLMGKALGMRTLGLVGLGAAVVTLATIEYHGLADQPDALSRVVQGVIQGVMAGIGFIGAGAILRDPQARHIEGLTTAASVWVTAALGIACAFAAWRVVAVGVGLALLLLVGFAWIEAWINRDKEDQSS
ncbi:MgtC/SapB family protein [Aestuariivirga sp. YIM B02566]|uniref:MgtC/SapB family protein n=1 Tax=Taklimakanibacter albus TaxID=2800327 RepID=A0ACC5R286_9HYPH|nr:MgtC/SapB family protein [Aestuariivirga sp. YIM B02566]MBK1866772.1 MgtC/SapB family protein [Aestuariivirga sp. YIM B02566]